MLKKYSLSWFSILLPLPLLAEESTSIVPLEDIPPPPEPYVEFMQLMLTLALIIAFLLIIMWWIKRYMNARVEQLNVSSSIKIIERRSLSPKSSLYIIEAMGKYVLAAESATGFSPLVVVDKAEAPID